MSSSTESTNVLGTMEIFIPFAMFRLAFATTCTSMRVLMQCQNVISTFQKMFSVFMLFLDYTSQIKADIPVIHFQLSMVIF